MPRFVILHHEMAPGSARPTHYDLMLEFGDVLRTWAIERPPSDTAGEATVRALALPDHRLMYLDYEGEVSGDRGRVTRWDAGEYELLEARETHKGLICVVLHGQRIHGAITLTPQGDGYWSINSGN